MAGDCVRTLSLNLMMLLLLVHDERLRRQCLHGRVERLIVGRAHHERLLIVHWHAGSVAGLRTHKTSLLLMLQQVTSAHRRMEVWLQLSNGMTSASALVRRQLEHLAVRRCL